jgi:putative oxidoreductase
MGFLGRYSEHTYALFRIVAGLLFATHGAQKIFGVLGGQRAEAPLMIAAGWIELVCGLLIAIGLLTSLAAFLASGQMAVAYFMAHASQHWWPVVNRGETAVLYCFAFLYIAARGAGIWSVDAARGAGRIPARAAAGGAAR